MLSSINVFVGL